MRIKIANGYRQQKIFPLLSVAFIIIGIFVLLSAKTNVTNFFAYYTIGVGVFCGAICLSIKKRIKVFQNNLNNSESKHLVLEKKANDIVENFFAVNSIPPDYRYPLALDTIFGFVKNLRASTWKECANLYEEQLHRWQMEANGAESLQLQREIRALTETAAKSAKAAAIFSGLNFFLK